MMHTLTSRALVLTSATLFSLGGAVTASAQGDAQEMETLKEQVELLKEQNRLLNTRLETMEQQMRQTAVQPPPPEPKESQQEGGLLGDHLKLGGSIEGDFIVADDVAGESNSEFNLDTVELILEAQATPWAKGKIVVDYDDEDEDGSLYIDEANVTLGGSEEIPVSLTGGKIYAPFGDFSTNMIQDPFTQTLGEVNEEGVIAGWEGNGLALRAFAYNGVDETGDDSAINGFGVSGEYSLEEGDVTLHTGVGWVSNIADADGILDALPRDEDDEVALGETVSGMNAYFLLGYAPFSLITEYTAALDSFAADELDFAGDGAEPKAVNLEFAYTTELVGKETVFALGFQKTWEALAVELPELRYSASAAVGIFEGTTIHLEYYLDEDYAESDGGTGDDGYGFTTRLAYEF